jgi:hypothetical protein
MDERLTRDGKVRMALLRDHDQPEPTPRHSPANNLHKRFIRIQPINPQRIHYQPHKRPPLPLSSPISTIHVPPCRIERYAPACYSRCWVVRGTVWRCLEGFGKTWWAVGCHTGGFVSGYLWEMRGYENPSVVCPWIDFALAFSALHGKAVWRSRGELRLLTIRSSRDYLQC